MSYHPPGEDHVFFITTPFAVGPAMKAEIPEVVEQTHMTPENTTAQVGDREFPVTVDAVDPNFFQMIKLPFAEGNPATALAQPESVVLTEATAKKFFGSADPIGKTVMLDGSRTLTVTALMRDLPHNTHLFIDLVIPNTSKADRMDLATNRNTLMNQWFNVQSLSYVKLTPHADLAAVEKKLPSMIDKHADPKIMNLKMPGSQLMHLHLTPFHLVHLLRFGELRWSTIYGFAAIAALIILIASINYMNLATARAMARAREVSLRKVMGAMRKQLVVQFMGESVIMALIALALALALVELLLPQFDTLLNRPIAYYVLSDWPLTLAIMAVAILVGLLGGIYPAFVLSSFRPAANLGTNASNRSGSGILRTALVVMQFAISIGLGVAAIVIFAQINYSQRMNLGFDRHNLLVLTGAGPLSPSAGESLTGALAADPAIAGAAQSNEVPFDGAERVAPINLPGGSQTFTVRHVDIDPNFLGVYGMRLLAGRDLSRARGNDIFDNNAEKGHPSNANVLINATAARQFGYTPENAVGHTLIFNAISRVTIVGVVGDANFDGVHAAMPPFLYFYNPAYMRLISVRIRPGRTREAVAAVDRIWHQFAPTVAIQRRFQDASFDRFFIDDELEGRIFAIFVGIAIFIACLGLFGLASFTAERRTKEIGIRKVYGARTRDIVRLLLWQFSIPVLVANLIAWPVAYYYLRNWLEGYAYRISLSPLYFVGVGAVALVIAWATVIVHAAHVARANPVHALRYE